MKIDKSKLEAMAALSDAELWQSIKSIASEHGVKMPDNQPRHEALARVRSALADAEKLNLIGAMRIVNDLK